MVLKRRNEGQGEQPSFRRCSGHVQVDVGPRFGGLPTTFSWVLVLLVGFALPVLDHKHVENLFDSGTHFGLGAVTNEAIQSADLRVDTGLRNQDSSTLTLHMPTGLPIYARARNVLIPARLKARSNTAFLLTLFPL